MPSPTCLTRQGGRPDGQMRPKTRQRKGTHMSAENIYIPRTPFLKTTMARAMVPRWQRRADELLTLERTIMARKWGALTVGRQLDELARRWPVSFRAMVIEIQIGQPVGWVEVAEAVEADLWAVRIRQRQR